MFFTLAGYANQPQYPAYQQQGGYPSQGYPMHHAGYPGQNPPRYAPVGQVPQGGIVLAQPGAVPTHVVVAPVLSNPPPDHMMFNIFMTLFCCWPIGIFAIMKSMACRDAIHRGNAEMAHRLSVEARRLGYWTLGVGILTVVVSLTIIIIFYSVYIPSRLPM